MTIRKVMSEIQDNKLYDYMKAFTIEILGYFKENIQINKIQKKITKKYNPVFDFDDNGKIRSFNEGEEELQSSDFRFFVYEYEDYIIHLKSFKHVIDYLKSIDISSIRLNILLIEFISRNIMFNNGFGFNLSLFNDVYFSLEKIFFKIPNEIKTYAIIPGLHLEDTCIEINKSISIKPFSINLFNIVFQNTKEIDYLRMMMLACNGKMSFIEITTQEIIQSDFMPGFMNHVDLIRNLVLCLRLFKEGDICTINFIQKSDNLIAQSGGTITIGSRVPFSSINMQYTLNKSEFDELRLFYESFMSSLSDFPSYINLAISRFNGIWFRKRFEDIIVDLIIAYESLFLSNNPEMSFRLAYSVAHYIGKTSQERKTIYTTIKNAYGIRSKIVHGSSSKSRSKAFVNTANIISSLQDYFRSVIQKMIFDKSFLLSKNSFLKKIEDIILK